MDKWSNLKELIESTLTETTGELTKELVELCQGILVIDTEAKETRIQSSSRLTEKEEVVLYCLGRYLLAYIDDSVSPEISWRDLEKGLGIQAKKISAYASVLKEDGLLVAGSRGSYRVRLAKMQEFLKQIRDKLGL